MLLLNHWSLFHNHKYTYAHFITVSCPVVNKVFMKEIHRVSTVIRHKPCRLSVCWCHTVIEHVLQEELGLAVCCRLLNPSHLQQTILLLPGDYLLQSAVVLIKQTPKRDVLLYVAAPTSNLHCFNVSYLHGALKYRTRCSRIPANTTH